MSFLGYIASLPAPKVKLGGQRLILRPPMLHDYEEWARLRGESRAFLQPKEPKWPEDALSLDAFRRFLSRSYVAWRADKSYSFFILDRKHRALVGGINLHNVRRNSTQSGVLGYWMGQNYAGQGIMSQAVGLTIQYAFGPLGLNRLEAACLLDNVASQRVLIKNHFQEVGVARSYLKINDHWQDHRIFELLREDWETALG